MVTTKRFSGDNYITIGGLEVEQPYTSYYGTGEGITKTHSTIAVEVGADGVTATPFRQERIAAEVKILTAGHSPAVKAACEYAASGLPGRRMADQEFFSDLCREVLTAVGQPASQHPEGGHHTPFDTDWRGL